MDWLEILYVADVTDNLVLQLVKIHAPILIVATLYILYLWRLRNIAAKAVCKKSIIRPCSIKRYVIRTIIEKKSSTEGNEARIEVDTKVFVLCNKLGLCIPERSNGGIVVAKPEFEDTVQTWIVVTTIVRARVETRDRRVSTGIIDRTRGDVREKTVHNVGCKGCVVKRRRVRVGSICNNPVKGIVSFEVIGRFAGVLYILERFVSVKAHHAREVTESIPIRTDDRRSVVVRWWCGKG